MSRKTKQTVKEMAGKNQWSQFMASSYGLPYTKNPAVFHLAWDWQDNLREQMKRGKTLMVFAKSKTNSLEHAVIENLKDVAELVNRGLRSGRAKDLRDLADAIEAVAGGITQYQWMHVAPSGAPSPVTDPMRYAMQTFAACEYDLRAKPGERSFYFLTGPIELPFTYNELADHLGRRLEVMPTEKSIRRAAQEMGWIFKRDKRGRRPGKWGQ